MTSTNDGKDVKSNQSSGPKGKSYYIELFKSLEAHLSGEGGLDHRSQHLCVAWQCIHNLCTHSTPATHLYLVNWLLKHTVKVILQTEWWKSPENKDKHASLTQAIDAFIDECKASSSNRNGSFLPWESQLMRPGLWFKDNLADPWGHPTLRVLMDPNPQRSTPNDEEVVKWLKQEPGVALMTRLRQLAASKCDDMALALATAVLDTVRANTVLQTDVELFVECKDNAKLMAPKSSLREILKQEAGYTTEVWEFLVDLEFVLLHKGDKRSRCIELSKQSPLDKSWQLVERLEKRLEISSREKKKEKLWKNAKEVATLIAQVVIARCMVLPTGVELCYRVLRKCASALARLVPPDRLPAAANGLAALAVTARHLHTLALAVDEQSKGQMPGFVCELYVRAITAGMNELEKLKLKTEKESEARSMEQTLASWFVHLGSLLRASDRINCECILTAFSVHPSAVMYGKIKASPVLTPVHVDPQEVKEESTSEFGSWANDSRSKTNLVKTSETLNMKQTQHQSNVLSTAILAEGEALGLNPDLCQDIAVLLSGPRVKTLSWDMDRVLLLENCKSYMERTHSGTKGLTTELKYLNLDPNDYQHLPEEEDNENDIYYGIEKGYEHLVEFQEPNEDNDDTSQNEHTDTALSGSDDSVSSLIKYKKKTKKHIILSDNELDPLSDSFVNFEKKEHLPSTERKKQRKKKTPVNQVDSLNADINVEMKIKNKKDKKEKKVKRKEKLNSNSSSHIFGTEILNVDSLKTASITDSDYDSQGKSSLHSHSEGNEELVYDGLYSMDELRSNHIQDQAVNLINPKMAVTKREVSIDKHDNSRNKIIDTLKTTNSSGSISEPMYKSVSEEVKRSLSRLLGERNNSHKTRAPIHKMPTAISRANVAIPTQINPKGITIPEMDIPQSYIEKRLETGCLNRTIINEPSVLKELPTMNKSTVKPVKYPLTVRDIITQKQRLKSNSETACQSDFKNFLQKLTQSQHAGVGSESSLHKHKAELRPVSRVVPFIPNCKAETTSPQSAKIVQHKKDYSLNTFSRLSYMHKNKIDKKKSIQTLLKQQTNYVEQPSSSELKLNQILIEQKQDKFKYLYPNLEIAKVDRNQMHAEANTMEQKDPILKSMLQSAAVDKHKKNSNLRIPINPINSSVLSVQDQNDLVHLLKQKNKLNAPLLQKSQVCGLFHKPDEKKDICKPHIPPTDLKIANESLFNVSMALTTQNNRNLIDTAPNCSNYSPYSTIPSKITKTSEIRIKNTLNIKEDEKPQTDWEEVMNNLLAHKTPSRGPNALDLALNKTSTTCEILRNQRIKKMSTNQAKVNSLEESNKISTDIRQVELIPTSQRSMVSNIDYKSVTKINTNLPHREVKHPSPHLSMLPNATHKHTTAPKIINKPKPHNNIRSESSKMQNIYMPKKPNHVESNRLSDEILKRQFTCNLPKQDDPFISGLPNSDYDLIEELMDDELRKEIGELSDDDFNVASGVSKDIKSLTTYNNLQMNKSVIIPPPKVDLKCEYEKMQRHKPAGSLKTVKNVLEMPQTQIKKVNNVMQTVQEIEKKDKLRPDVIQGLPGNITNKTASKKDCSAITEMNKNVLNVPESSVYVIPPPTMSNVILVGRNLYNTYSTVPTELPMTNVSSNLYLNQPNISVYHSTQYAAPVMNSVIIGSAITVPTPILHQKPSAAHTVPDTAHLSNIPNPIKPLSIKKEVEKCPKNHEATLEECSKNNQVVAVTTVQSDKTIVDLKLNKNGERKVLSQVQKKNEKSDLIRIRSQRCSVESNFKKDQDNEKLSKKRMSIITKMIYHGYNKEPIPLTYTPLKPISVYVDENVKSTSNKKDTDNLDSVLKSLSETEEKNNFLKDDVNNGDAIDTNENSKENNSTASCRRILLRSSNKIVGLPIAMSSKETSGLKAKVRLKESFTEKNDGMKVSTEKKVDKKVINTKNHVIKRLNKTLSNGKVKKAALKKKTDNQISKGKDKINITKRQLNKPKVAALKLKKDVTESLEIAKNQITPQLCKIFEKPDLSIHKGHKIPTVQMFSNVKDIKSSDSDNKKVEKIVIRKINANKHEIATTTISNSLDITETKINRQSCNQSAKSKTFILPETKAVELEKALTKVKHLLKPSITQSTPIEKIKEKVVDKIADKSLSKLSKSKDVNDTNTCEITHKEITKTSNFETKEPYIVKTDTDKQHESLDRDVIGAKESLQKKDAVVFTKIENIASKPVESNNKIEDIKHMQPSIEDSTEYKESNLPKIDSIHIKNRGSKNDVQSNSKCSDKICVLKESDALHMTPSEYLSPNEGFKSTSTELIIELNQDRTEPNNSIILDNKDMNNKIGSVETMLSRNATNTLEPKTVNLENIEINTSTNLITSMKSKVAGTADIIDREDIKTNINCLGKSKNPIIISDQCPKNTPVLSVTDTKIRENVPSDKGPPNIIHNKSIIDSIEGEIVIEHLPNPGEDSNKQLVRIKLPNKKTYKATIYGKHVDVNTLFSDPTFKSRLFKNSTNCLELILNYTRKGIPQPIETVNLLSDEEDEVSDYSFSTEFGKYKVRSINKDEFIKHQKRLNQKCYVKLERTVPEKPTDIVELTNKTTSDFTEMLKCNEIMSPLDNCNQENISILEKKQNDTDLIVIDDSSNDSVILVPPLNEDINTLKDLLCKELCLETTLPSDAVENEEMSLEVVKCRECFVQLSRCDDLVKKYEQNKILSKTCVVKLKRCDESSVSMNAVISHNIPNNFNMNESNLEAQNVEGEDVPVMSRSGSLSILNEFALYDGYDFVNNHNLKLERSSPVMEIYDSFCEQKEIKIMEKTCNKVLNTIICDSDLFETKGKLRRSCMISISNDCTLFRQKYKDPQNNVSMNKKKVFNVPSLTALIVSFFQSNDVLQRLRSSNTPDQFHKHIPRLKRKYTGDRSSPAKKVAKTLFYPLDNKSNLQTINKAPERKRDERYRCQNNEVIALKTCNKSTDKIKVPVEQNISIINNSDTKQNNMFFHYYQSNKGDFKSVNEPYNTLNYVKNMTNDLDKTDQMNSLSVCYSPVSRGQSTKILDKTPDDEMITSRNNSSNVACISKNSGHDGGTNVLSKLGNFKSFSSSNEIYNNISMSNSCLLITSIEPPIVTHKNASKDETYSQIVCSTVCDSTKKESERSNNADHLSFVCGENTCDARETWNNDCNNMHTLNIDHTFTSQKAGEISKPLDYQTSEKITELRNEIIVSKCDDALIVSKNKSNYKDLIIDKSKVAIKSICKRIFTENVNIERACRAKYVGQYESSIIRDIEDKKIIIKNTELNESDVNIENEVMNSNIENPLRILSHNIDVCNESTFHEKLRTKENLTHNNSKHTTCETDILNQTAEQLQKKGILKFKTGLLVLNDGDSYKILGQDDIKDAHKVKEKVPLGHYSDKVKIEGKKNRSGKMNKSTDFTTCEHIKHILKCKALGQEQDVKNASIQKGSEVTLKNYLNAPSTTVPTEPSILVTADINKQTRSQNLNEIYIKSILESTDDTSNKSVESYSSEITAFSTKLPIVVIEEAHKQRINQNFNEIDIKSTSETIDKASKNHIESYNREITTLSIKPPLIGTEDIHKQKTSQTVNKVDMKRKSKSIDNVYKETIESYKSEITTIASKSPVLATEDSHKQKTSQILNDISMKLIFESINNVSKRPIEFYNSETTTLPTKPLNLETEDIHKERNQVLYEVEMKPMSEVTDNISKKPVESYNSEITTLPTKRPILETEDIHKPRIEVLNEVEMKPKSEVTDNVSKKPIESCNSEITTLATKPPILETEVRHKQKSSQISIEIEVKPTSEESNDNVPKEPIESYNNEITVLAIKSPILATEDIHKQRKSHNLNDIHLNDKSESSNNTSNKPPDSSEITLTKSSTVLISGDVENTRQISNEDDMKSISDSIDNVSKKQIGSYNSDMNHKNDEKIYSTEYGDLSFQSNQKSYSDLCNIQVIQTSLSNLDHEYVSRDTAYNQLNEDRHVNDQKQNISDVENSNFIEEINGIIYEVDDISDINETIVCMSTCEIINDSTCEVIRSCSIVPCNKQILTNFDNIDNKTYNSNSIKISDHIVDDSKTKNGMSCIKNEGQVNNLNVDIVATSIDSEKYDGDFKRNTILTPVVELEALNEDLCITDRSSHIFNQSSSNSIKNICSTTVNVTQEINVQCNKVIQPIKKLEVNENSSSAICESVENQLIIAEEESVVPLSMLDHIQSGLNSTQVIANSNYGNINVETDVGEYNCVISEEPTTKMISASDRITHIDSLQNDDSNFDIQNSNAHICKTQDTEIVTETVEIITLLDNTTEQENIVPAKEFTTDYSNEYTLQSERELQGIEYHDPELGTCYVFNVVETISSDDANSDIVSQSSATVTADEEYNEFISECQDNCELKLKMNLPLITYSRKDLEPPMQFDYNPDKKCRRTMKRKSSSIDTRPEKKYRKGKNIDYPKFTALGISESAYGKEYKQLTDYWRSIKFSYSRSFHRDYIDVQEMLNNWPINGLINTNVTNVEPDNTLFIDLEDICNPKILVDPTSLTLAEEIEFECKEVILPSKEINETNFNMGFGEGSDRVIQNLEDGGDVSISSAATLSDVKQNQPCLQSENCDQNNNSTSRYERNIIKKCFSYINLKEKVKTFFQKTSFDLNSSLMVENKKMDYNYKNHICNFPFDLISTEFFEIPQNETIVNVVQVGQLPVSAAAQNPVTCDPRVTQVSDASPSQCSAENTSSDDPQSAIKSEYTELTTADISLPLQDYSQQDRSNTLETQETCNVQINNENIPIETEIKSIVKIELVEELPEEKEDETLDNSESLLENQNISNVDYTFDTSSVNTPSDDSNFHMIFNSAEKQNTSETLSPQKQRNGSSEKSDQIAHAMNAAGITTTPDTLANTRAQAIVNILSQKIRQGTVNVTASQASTNTFSKTSINAVALQQALAQILPPPLNQTNTETNQPNTSVTPQVLHIVQGKNASGNQITLVENTQQSVISTSNPTPVLHIVQNKSALAAPISTAAPTAHTNTFSSISLVDTGLQQGGNQLLHIVNTSNQKTSNAGQLLKRVNLLTNLANVQGSNEQKMVQFVCKSADGKAIQLNAPHQRSMVLRLQPIETPNIQNNVQKSTDSQDNSPNATTTVIGKEGVASQQEIKSRSVYEENYAKFIQNSSTKPVTPEKATSLPKFNQAFGKQVFQDGTQKNENNNANAHIPISAANSENSDCQQTDNGINLEHINQINSPPLLLRKTPVPTSQAQSNLVQQIKQTIAPMNLQTMHGGVIYTRQIPVNIGGGQTINLITVPSTELIEDTVQKQSDVKFVNQSDIEPSIIKIVPQTQTAPNGEVTQEENVTQLGVSAENAQTPQPVLTQMRIKLPMLSKAPQMVSGARVVRPSFFQIQRNVIGGANHPLYQQLVLTAAPQLGQQTIRLPQTQTRNNIKVSSDTQSSTESQMSSSTLEQLREFDLVLEQVKERSTVQPNSNSNTSFSKLHTSSTDSTDGSASVSSTSTDSTQQVLYSIGNNQPMNVSYVNRKSTITTPTTSTYVRSPDSSGIADSPSSSSQVQLPHTVTTESTSNETPVQTKPHKVSSKSKSRSKSSSNPPNTLKLNTVPSKTSTQKPLEDEQTTQRILYILAEYKEQVENSPDKDKPAPRRRSNPPSNSSGSSKRKKSSSGSRRPGCRDLSPVQGDDTCRTMGSEDSSCGTSQGDCNESCMESHSPQDSPRKVVRKLTFEHETLVTQPRPQPQRNVIVADGQTITVARGTAGKPATAVLMPANYILPVSMVKGGQQIAIVTNRGPKLLTVGGGEGGATNALLLQRLIGPAGLKPVLTRPGVRHVRLPTAALHNLQAFNFATATTIQPPDSTASPAPAPTPPDLVESQAASSPWADRESHDVKPERGSSPEGSEPWNLPSSADPHDYTYEETVRADSMDRTVLDPIPDRYSPDMEAQRIFDKMFDVDSKRSYIVDSPRCGYDIDTSDCDDKGYHQVVQKKDGPSHRQQRLTHVSAAALRHKYAILEHELRLQKSLSEECEDLGVDSPSAAELFPEAELLFAASPAHDHTQDQGLHSHTPQPTHLNHSGIPQPDIDDQIATDQLLTRTDDLQDRDDLNLGLEDVGIVTVSEDGMQATIALDQEEFARSHPNTTFHSEPTDDGEVQQSFTLSSLKSRHITSTIFHANRAPGTVLMTTPQTTVISQATGESSGIQGTVKYSDIDNMINSLPSAHGNNINLSSVLVKDDGLTRFDSILNDSRELHLSNTASAIVHSTGNGTQVIRRVCYDDDKRDSRFLIDEPDALIAGDDAKMIAEDSSREALESITGDVDDDRSSPERHAELFWESNSASERSESRRPLDFSSDSDKCCKSPSFDETNSTDSSGVGTHMRLDSVIKEARGIERSGSADGSSADDTHPPLRTYPPKRNYHTLDGEMERSMSGKTRAGERSPDSLEVRRRASGRGVVKRGCHCCNGSPAPSRPKKSRQRKSGMDFTNN